MNKRANVIDEDMHMAWVVGFLNDNNVEGYKCDEMTSIKNEKEYLYKSGKEMASFQY